MGGRGAPSPNDGLLLQASLRPLQDEPASATTSTPGTDASLDSRPSAPATAAPSALPGGEGARRETEDLVTIPGAYVDARQLTELPRPLHEPPLHLLSSVLASTGVARLTLYIDQAGHVTSVEVGSSTLPAQATDRAVAVFSQTRFAPGRIGGLAVRSRIGVTVGAERRDAGG